MASHYPRYDVAYDYDTLQDFVATGRATFYPGGGGVWVVKNTDGTSVAVRSHQVVRLTNPPAEVAGHVTEAPQPQPESSPAGIRSRAWVTREEEDDLLRYFNI